ncbi:hypothetical protein [Ramlibacter sp. AN1133]|uniref:hypothetical protein n=1 Tax=Ramlibacter sp. AN1133 TaxID=3133429 RepID=UPI0030BD61A8
MTNLSSQQMLKYAYLQLASEATGLVDGLEGERLADVLTVGNSRASVFTRTEANTFVSDGWTVVAHVEKNSGFSGTLFKDKAGNLVLSFRSTEFADDAVRDNQQTNKTEIRNHGWAFGQIADMEAWYAGLLRDPDALGAGQRFAVTGYSLGGHLATAFDIMRHEDGTSGRITEVFTFNGAGVGQTQSSLSLHTVIDTFSAARVDGSNAASFGTSVAANLYAQMSAQMNGAATVEVADGFIGQINAAVTQLSTSDPGTHRSCGS